MQEWIAYHAVTDRPMTPGQRIVFDENHHSGVYARGLARAREAQDCYEHPRQELDHHLMVALRELALEEVRQKEFPDRPSRLACLYVAETREEAEKWAGLFAEWGRPTYHVVKLRIRGRLFAADACNCFDATCHREENFRLARRYWENRPNAQNQPPIIEYLADGEIEVLEIVKEIGKNI